MNQSTATYRCEICEGTTNVRLKTNIARRVCNGCCDAMTWDEIVAYFEALKVIQRVKKELSALRYRENEDTLDMPPKQLPRSSDADINPPWLA